MSTVTPPTRLERRRAIRHLPGHPDLPEKIGGQVEAIIAAAEATAAVVRRDAEADATHRRHEAEVRAAAAVAEATRRAREVVRTDLEAARAVTDELAAQVRQLIEGLEDVQRAHRSAVSLLERLVAASARMELIEGGAAQLEESVSAPGASERISTADDLGFGLREAPLRALEMAMGGRTRSEVEHDLRHGFHIADPATILDEVFGKGSSGSSRIPWSTPGEAQQQQS